MTVIQRERHDRVEVVRIDRPEARNAIDGDVARGMEAALDALEDDDGVAAVVITGTGDVFSAGADLKLVARGRGAEVATSRGGFAGITTRAFPKPLVAAVNGPALAGGFEIALACDLVVAADTARFGLPEVQRGLIAAAGGLVRLPRRIPLAAAMELALTGDPITVARAFELGLVNRVVPAAAVLEEALGLAGRIAEHGPLAVRRSLALLRESGELSEAEAWAKSYEYAGEVFTSRDAIEGATAFAERRAPRWTGT